MSGDKVPAIIYIVARRIAAVSIREIFRSKEIVKTLGRYEQK
jgi:hypothetical protein